MQAHVLLPLTMILEQIEGVRRSAYSPWANNIVLVFPGSTSNLKFHSPEFGAETLWCVPLFIASVSNLSAWDLRLGSLPLVCGLMGGQMHAR